MVMAPWTIAPYNDFLPISSPYQGPYVSGGRTRSMLVPAAQLDFLTTMHHNLGANYPVVSFREPCGAQAAVDEIVVVVPVLLRQLRRIYCTVPCA